MIPSIPSPPPSHSQTRFSQTILRAHTAKQTGPLDSEGPDPESLAKTQKSLFD